MNRNAPQGPVYSVDWHSEASGKRLGATKRRVRFRFGFANVQALDGGLTGVDCRGEEHELVLVWSLASGKRLVIVDGQEVHFSMGHKMESKFDTSFSMFGGHVFKIIAHATPPLSHQPGFRQFDLQLDGRSFDTFPKIFELGLQSCARRVEQQYSYDDTTTYSEERNFATPPALSNGAYENQRAPVPITPEVPHRPVVKNVEHPRPSNPVVVEDLLSGHNDNRYEGDLLWNSAPQLTYHASTYEQPQHYHNHQQQLLQGSGSVHSAPAQFHYHQQEPKQPNENYYQQASPRGIADEFAPVPPPPRTFQDVSKDILSAYTPDPSILALPYTAHYSNEAYESSCGTMATQEDAQVRVKDVTPQQKAVLKPTMEPVSIVEMEERDQPPLSAMERAVRALVNLEDITETLETPEQAKTERNKEQNQPVKSKPLPPSTPAWNLGLRPALGDIQECAQPKAAPKKEIMRTHAFDPAATQAGMMVVYGATAPSTLIPAASGFGAGVHPAHNYYNNRNVYNYQHSQRVYAAY